MNSGSSPDILQVECNARVLEFKRAELSYSPLDSDRPIWSFKNNKTVRQTLGHPRYSKLARACAAYQADLDLPLGQFLYARLNEGNDLVMAFLNADGNASFGLFQLTDVGVAKLRGLYLYRVGEEIVYVGRCLDSFAKRINQGYGKIHPKNCYIDGQRTNCRLNALLVGVKDSVSFYVCPLQDDYTIRALESELLRKYRPRWNKQLA